jgi:hypothetical protein
MAETTEKFIISMIFTAKDKASPIANKTLASMKKLGDGVMESGRKIVAGLRIVPKVFTDLETRTILLTNMKRTFSDFASTVQDRMKSVGDSVKTGGKNIIAGLKTVPKLFTDIETRTIFLTNVKKTFSDFAGSVKAKAASLKPALKNLGASFKAGLEKARAAVATGSKAIIDRLKILADKAKAKMNEIKASMKDAASKINENMQKIGKFALAGGAAIVGGLAIAGKAMLDLALDAAPLANVRKAFEDLNSWGAGKMLAELEKASGGMIAQTDLMLSFNKASQLVGKDFAQRLPDAMGALGKVASATGQDLDFLLDSLVTGVGRLSPMILDNLGIQVDLVAAQEAYAAELGKSVDELSKAEQQTALMNQVMEKLAVNTADMVDPANSAAGAMARWEAMVANVRDTLGATLLPVLGSVADTITQVAGKVLPTLTEFFETVLVPTLQMVDFFFNQFLLRLADGEPFLESFFLALRETFIDTPVMGKIEELGNTVLAFRDKVMEAITPVIDWIKENVKLSDVLIGLGVAIASVVIPIIASIVTAIAPVIATFLAVVAVVALLRKAWESDFLGIRSTMESVWERLKPIWDRLINVLETRLPPIIEKLTAIFNEKIRPALERLGIELDGEGGLIGLIGDGLVFAIGALVDILDWALAGFEKIEPVIWGFAEGIGWAIDQVAALVSWVTELGNELINVTIPEMFQPGSPPPFAIGLSDINKQMRTMARASLPSLQSSLGNLELSPSLPGGAGAGVQFGDTAAGGAQSNDNRTFNLFLTAPVQGDDVKNSFELMAGGAPVTTSR